MGRGSIRATSILEDELTRNLLVEMGYTDNPLSDLGRFMAWTEGKDSLGSHEGRLERFRAELKVQETADWNDPKNVLILAVAESMRMTGGEIPLDRDVDLGMTMGGARLEPYLRPKYLIGSGHEIGRVVVTGSRGKVQPDEREIARDYASPVSKLEYDLAVDAARKMTLEHPDLLVTPFFSTMSPAHNQVVMEAVLSAFQDEKNPIKSFAVCTTMIYNLACLLDLYRVIKNTGIEGVLVCNPSRPEVVAKRSPLTYANEIIRTWQACVRAIQEGA